MRVMWGLEGYVEGGRQYQAQGLVCQGSLKGVSVKAQSSNGSLRRLCCSCQNAIMLMPDVVRIVLASALTATRSQAWLDVLCILSPCY